LSPEKFLCTLPYQRVSFLTKTFIFRSKLLSSSTLSKWWFLSKYWFRWIQLYLSCRLYWYWLWNR